MRNLEFKARCDDHKAAMAKARVLGFDLCGDLRQTDTYFRVASGRLKLRETSGFQGELIYYRRDEGGANRASDYEVATTADPAALRHVLSDALGVLAVVKKRRTLLVLDGARIHLDNVEGQGAFLEIEVPVHGDEAAAERRMAWLMAELGLDWDSCIRASYLDLTLSAEETKA
jgi:predicted adenylyl cyclase CyaB